MQKRIALTALLVLLPALCWAGSMVEPLPLDETMAVVNPGSEVSLQGVDLIATEQGSKAKTGTIIIKNFTDCYLDIYGDGKLIYRDLPPGWKLTLKRVAQGWHTGYAKGCGYRWGPEHFNLGRRFVMKLY